MSQDDLTCAIRQGMNEERASAGDLEGALRNLSNCGPHSPYSEEQDFIFSSMAQYELKSGNLFAALSHIQAITRPDLRDGALTQIAYSSARSGHFQESLNLADKITEISGRVTAPNGVALILFKQRQSEKSSLALQFALLAANGIPKLRNRRVRKETTLLLNPIRTLTHAAALRGLSQTPGTSRKQSPS